MTRRTEPVTGMQHNIEGGSNVRQQVTWNDIPITGKGTADDGTYSRVKVLGDSIIEGDLT